MFFCSSEEINLSSLQKQVEKGFKYRVSVWLTFTAQEAVKLVRAWKYQQSRRVLVLSLKKRLH